MYRLVGMERFMSSSNWPSAARQVFAADSPVQSERTNIGFGSTSFAGITAVCWFCPSPEASSDSLAADAEDAAAASRSGSCSATVVPSCAAVDVTGVFRELDACERRDLRCFLRRLRLELARARMASAARALASSGDSIDEAAAPGVDVATAIFLAPAPAAVVEGPAANKPASPSTLISFIAASTAFRSAPRPPSRPSVSSFRLSANSPASFSSFATRSPRSRSFASASALALASSCCACLTRSLARSTLSSIEKASSLTGAASPVTRSKTPVFAPVLTKA
mmetsp:Transcript_9264/g.36015  ORF Transcript_9264/g.36015 Transcript_9264/m.36015 type:complete len:281 (+) Transcript_9264:905-1747(+)